MFYKWDGWDQITGWVEAQNTLGANELFSQHASELGEKLLCSDPNHVKLCQFKKEKSVQKWRKMPNKVLDEISNQT